MPQTNLTDLDKEIMTQEVLRVLLEIARQSNLSPAVMPALVQAFKQGAIYMYKTEHPELELFV